MNSICEDRYDYSPIIKLEHLINPNDINLYIFIGKNKQLKDLLENVSFEINDPCQTKADIDIQQSLIEILGKHFLKILFNPGKNINLFSLLINTFMRTILL